MIDKGLTSPMVHKASQVYKEVFKGSDVDIIDCAEASDDINAYKKLDADGKKECARRMRMYLNKNPKAVIMVFAPWCGHCHNTFPRFKEAAEKNKNLPHLLINAEVISRHELQELSSIEYFPTFLAKNKREYTLVKTPDEAAKLLADDPTPPQRTPPTKMPARRTTPLKEAPPLEPPLDKFDRQPDLMERPEDPDMFANLF